MSAHTGVWKEMVEAQDVLKKAAVCENFERVFRNMVSVRKRGPTVSGKIYRRKGGRKSGSNFSNVE